MEPTWSRLGLVVRFRVKVVAGMRIRVRARVRLNPTLEPTWSRLGLAVRFSG